jgi:uncharacterized membrane protein YdjX (TVP38/TMEM64 family)
MSAAGHDERTPSRWPRIAAAITAIALVAGWMLLPLHERIGSFEHRLIELGPWGVALFALVYIVATISLAPEWPLTIAAGLVYGAWAIPITLGAATLAASLAFLIARHLARDRVRALLRHRIFTAIDDAVSEEGWKIVALLRLSPAVPFNLQNYLFGVTAISFVQFAPATFAGIVPGTLLYVYLGMLGKAATSGGAFADRSRWVLFPLGLTATIAAVILVTRKAMTKLRAVGIGERSR